MSLLWQRYFRGVLRIRTCSHDAFISHRHASKMNYDFNFKNTKFWKRVFSSVLFGGTFLAVVLLKRIRKLKQDEIFQECTLMVADQHYAKQNMFYKFKGYVLPDFVIKARIELESFQVHPDDIFVVSFPKTGTTWIQEIVYLIGNNLNLEKAFAVGIETRFPYLEFIYPGVKGVAKQPPPRFIKSHLPYSLLPKEVETKKPKIICVLRNPKDVCVSFFHFVQTLVPTSFSGTFEDFFETFLDDKVMYGPIWKHYLEFWERRNQENLLILMYEELQKDLQGSIRKIAFFLEKPLTEEEITLVADHCSFKNMAANSSVNYQYWSDIGVRHKDGQPFMRKGIVGDWKNYFSQDMNRRMDLWIEEKFKSSGLSFTYSLDEIRKKD